MASKHKEGLEGLVLFDIQKIHKVLEIKEMQMVSNYAKVISSLSKYNIQ